MKRTFAVIFIASLFLLVQVVSAQKPIVQLKWKLAPQNDSVYMATQVASAGFVLKLINIILTPYSPCKNVA